QRAKMTPEKAGKAVKVGVVAFVNEIYDVLNDTLNAISNVFFKSEKSFENKAIVDKKSVLIDEINSAKISTKSIAKQNEPVWSTRIMLAAKTKESLRSELLANTIGSAYAELAGDNELTPIKIKYKTRR